ncbi:baseplate J/gp47 family protein [Ancylobacter polymorphus]|uniref:Phage-related baseplate assembly protein n=1 Tax=Ancylobacter polymorphus TaxID=223390 RepID=A0ABU0B7P8_9HYPH|nr:baseplate J/gp47 family protein [Ancylobacter polymorphus]MDQ0301358.1 phage-related baseplate assembly protein [Ancylobacter polymorphus]
MAVLTIADLAGFPAAEAIETLGVEQILARHVADFLAGWDALRSERPDLNLPPFDTAHLETEETRIIFRPGAFREMLLRGRINDAIRANLLAYASGSDIDHLAVFYGVTRLVGETDQRLKLRTILAIQGRSTGGTAPRYRGEALGASLRVEDARPYRDGRDPTINVAVLSTDNNGVADAGLLATVTAALNADAVRMVNDVIKVIPAVKNVVSIAAKAWLLPNSSDAVINEAAGALRSAWAAESGIGFDLVPEWVTARLMIAGLQRVQVITPYVEAGPNEAIALGDISIVNEGRAY